MKKVFLLFLLISLFVSPGAAEEKWTKVEMTNFTLVGPASEKELKNVGNKLEQFRQTLSQLMPKAKLNSSAPTVVYVFDSYDDFQSYFNYAKNERKIAGQFISTADANYINLSIEKKHYDIYDVIFHEYFHYVLRRNLFRVPLWLNEGMAEYFSTFDIDESGTKIKIGIPAARRVLELRKRDFLPLDKLFAVNGKSPEYKESDRVGVFYAQSWALVHFLLTENNGQRKDQLFNFVDLINAGIAPKDAFQKAFQTDYKKIENDLRAYINRFSFPGFEYELDKKIAWDETAKVSQISEAEIKFLQGNLLRYTGTPEKAEKKLLEAIALNSENAEAYRLLGAVYDYQKKFPEARRNFEKALVLEPNNYVNYYNLVKFLREDKNYDEAVKYCRQAIKLKPDAGRIYSALGSIYENLFRDEEAAQAYAQALKLNPEYGVNYFNLAKIAFRNSKYELAHRAAKATIDTDAWINNNSVKSALIAYFAYRRDNKPERAAEMLKLALEKVEAKNFYHQVFRYLNGEITEPQLLESAKDQNDQTISNGYIGLNLLAQSKNDEAKAKFQWIKEKGNRDFTEYGYAVKELERLEAAENQKTGNQ